MQTVERFKSWCFSTVQALFGAPLAPARSDAGPAAQGRDRFPRSALVLAAFLLPSLGAAAAQIEIAQQDALLFDSGNLVSFVDNTDSSYSATLDANNLGTFSWTFANTTGATLSNATFFVFLDADIDRAINGASNEYGQVVAQQLPAGAPANAITWSSFQIDEPGFVSGTILNNLLSGALDNTNHVPPGTTNDVSFALGFALGPILAGQQTTGTFQISTSNIGGLSQTDPDSAVTFYFNGYATAPAFGPNGTVSSVPEPSSTALMLLGMAAFGVLALKKKEFQRHWVS